MSEHVLQVESREATGKEYAKKLRQAGKVPGVFYAHNEKSVAITFDEREIMKTLTSSEAGLIDIQIGGDKTRKAIIKEVQTDPIKNYLVHVDVMGVSLEEKITVSVPIHIVGEAVGVKDQGGILHNYIREVEVSCLPLDIPEYIDVDVSELNMGDSIQLSILTIDKVSIVGDLDQPIVSVLMPKVVIEEVVEEEGVEEGVEGEEEAETSEDDS
ncbi:50S ribosomal protein L25 [candidate division KSB1 bacterium]|nr:50S ribosomal protein L25 [candidate division KSB1 bacterium]MBL7095809.1 50S ribosomal protein L25 [candidate division KSB1 bacterium]